MSPSTEQHLVMLSRNSKVLVDVLTIPMNIVS